MRKWVLGFLSLVVLGVSVFLGAQPGPDRLKMRLRLVDAETGKGVGGIVRVFGADNKPIELTGLFDRMSGLTKDLPGVHWYVIPVGGVETTLPRGKLQIHALSGLETGLTRHELDLRSATPAEATIKLAYLFRPDDLGLVAGNTHLHLRGFSRAHADEYLRKIPAADGLRVMFISYLERDKDDKGYITNEYIIPCFETITIDNRLLAIQHFFHKYCHYSSFAVWILAGTIDIPVAESYIANSILLRIIE